MAYTITILFSTSSEIIMVIMMIFREAFFKAGDLHNPKDFQTALNRTFRIGTLLCHFKQTELLHLVANLASEARKRAQSVTYRRRTIANAGRQDGTSLIFLSPTQILDLTTGSLVIHNFNGDKKIFFIIFNRIIIFALVI